MSVRRHRQIKRTLLPTFDAMEGRVLCTVTVVVPGTANPYLANPANDSGPSESRDGTAPPSIDVTGDAYLAFSSTGGDTNNLGVRAIEPPDGGTLVSAYYGARGGISSWDLPIDMVAGIFLGSTTAVAPAEYAGSLAAKAISPKLGQVFPIGDGLTGDGTGSPQEFQVPAGAKRLYLVDIDGFQWGNNGGKVDVTVDSTPDLSAKSASYNGANFSLNYAFQSTNYSGPVTVGFYRSSRKTYSPNDPTAIPIASVSIDATAGNTRAGSITLSSPLKSNPSLPYLLLVIDPGNLVKEATTTRGDNTLPFSAPGTTGTYQGTSYVVYGNEVRLGGSRSWRNNNPGNLAFAGTFATNHGAIGTDGTFAIFPDEATGTAAVTADLLTAKYQALTIYGAMSAYAPPRDNNTAAYIAFIKAQTGLDPKAEMSSLTGAQLASIVGAIRVYEGWIPGQIYLANATAPAWVVALLYNGTT